MNEFVPEQPGPAGHRAPTNGDGNVMDFALITGDHADNAQRNETDWVRELLEGGTPLNFNSGVTDPADSSTRV